MSIPKDQSSSILSKWKSLHTAQNQTQQNVQDSNRYTASKGQQRLYFINQLHAENPVYNLTEVWNINGKFDPSVFKKALNIVGQRQDILRTTFHLEEEDIICRIHETFDYKYQYIDLTEHESAIKTELDLISRRISKTIFDLANGPLIYVCICRTATDSHSLIINIHHIISDKWSMRIMRQELSEIYSSLRLETVSQLDALSCQYIDYAQDQFSKNSKSNSLNYWKKRLGGLDHHISIPSNKEESRNVSLKGKYSRMAFPPSLSKSIIECCREEKITPFIFFLTIFKIVIYKYTSHTDIVIGTPISTRSKQEYESIIGFFNDTMALRSQIGKSSSFKHYLTVVKKSFFEAFEHKDVGFEEVLNTVNPKRVEHVNPIFQMMFLYHKEYVESTFAQDLEINILNYDMGVSKFDLTLYISERGQDFELIIEYATDLYTEDYIQRLHKHIHEISSQVLYNPGVRIDKLSCIGLKESDEIIHIGSGPKVDFTASNNWISDIFQNADPDVTALVDENSSKTYAELDQQSNQIASEIRQLNINTHIIGIVMDQSVDFVVSMIGILKAGYAYLPIDISYPVDHINHVLEDANVELVLSKRGSDLNQINGTSHLYLEDIKASNKYEEHILTDDTAAYVIYTSGSTGKPNGVAISHKNLLNSTKARFEYYDEHPSAYLLLSSFSFDSSVAGIYWTLMNGGKIVIPKKESIQDIDFLSGLIIKENISHTLLIPSLYLVYLECMSAKVLAKLQLVILAGEVLTPNIAKRHFDTISQVRLYNEYGPTEATVWSSAYELKSTDECNNIPIGRATANHTLLVLDDDKNLVPFGIAGELYISGPSVSKGYLNSPQKTAHKFISKKVGNHTYSLYKTGDLVKWNANRHLIFLGRKDHQVKVRGHRIELGEIDSMILSFANDLQVATVYIVDKKEIVSFIVSNNKVDKGKLSAYIAEKLPRHYCPDHILQLDEFPLMANGKVNYRALIKETKNIATKASHTQVNETSEQSNMLAIWREILQKPELTIEDNFFEFGGDSIQIIRIIAKARKLGYSLSPKDIYSYQTIAELSHRFVTQTTSVVRALSWELLPLSPIQEWFFETHRNNPHHWLQGFSMSPKISITIKQCKDVIQLLINEYEIFQTCFVMEYGKWFHKKETYKIDDFFIDQKDAHQIKDHFNITSCPLIKFIFFADNDKINSIKIIMHHLVTDAVTWSILIADLEAKLTNVTTKTPTLHSEYFQWINRLHVLSRTHVFNSSISFWNSMLGHRSSFFKKSKLSLERNTHVIFESINRLDTEEIIKSCDKVSSLKIEEVIIASFLQVFYKHTAEQELTIMLERMGRNSDQINIDLTESIGWHTAYYPVHFKLSDPSSELRSLLDVKEQLRRVPHHGQSYGILKYLSNKISAPTNTNVVFNFLGNRIHSSGETFENMEFLVEGMRDPLSERDYLIEINAWLYNGKLEYSFAYDHTQLAAETMNRWSEDMRQHLKNIPLGLNDKLPVKTPSDFNYWFLQKDLDVILLGLNVHESNIQDILELTSTQSALLFHSLQNQFNDQGLIIASGNINGTYTSEYLQSAWNQIIKRHDILRSYFIWENISKPAQVICESVKSKIEFIIFDRDDISFDQYIDNWIEAQPKPLLKLNSSPIYRFVCFKRDSQLSKIVFICHHIYMDGWSTLQLFNELLHVTAQLKSNVIISHVPKLSLKEWKTGYDKERDNINTKTFWESYLHSVKPTFLKSNTIAESVNFEVQEIIFDRENTKKLSQLIADSKITMNVFFIGIWSWLLSKYVKESSVVIGLTHAGRSIPIDQMDSMLGMFSNVLPFISNKLKFGEIDFNQIQKNVNELLERDAVNIDDIDLSKIQRRSNLFDTLLIIQNFISKDSHSKDLFISDFKSKISSLIPLSVIVIPGDLHKIICRYNSSLYTSDEIRSIQEDLVQLIHHIKVENSLGNILYVPKYIPSQHEAKILPEVYEKNFSASKLTTNHKASSFQDEILDIWKHVLRLNDIHVDDNYFQIGGTSLMAVRIFNKIEKLTGINASPLLLIKHNSVKSLCAALEGDSFLESWQTIYPFTKGGDLDPLFCFHAGEGHILFYKELAESIHQDRPVYGVQPIGLNGEEVQFKSIEDMAGYYISEMRKKHPKGPYHLLGTCFSNAVTFEIAKQIKSEIACIFIVDSPPPHFNELSKLKKWMHWVYTFNIPKLKEAFNNYFKYADFRKPKDIQSENLFNTGKHLRSIMSTYKWLPLRTKITLIRSSQNANDKHKDYHFQNWKKLTTEGIDIIIINGDHITLFEQDSAIQMSKAIDLKINSINA